MLVCLETAQQWWEAELSGWLDPLWPDLSPSPAASLGFLDSLMSAAGESHCRLSDLMAVAAEQGDTLFP